jgi:hypothetical protein
MVEQEQCKSEGAVDEAKWLSTGRNLAREGDRDLGYVHPGSVRYVISKRITGYVTPLRISVEMPVDKLIASLPAAGESAFDREKAAFDRMLAALLASHSGKFVAVQGGQVIDMDDDEFALAQRIERDHRGEFVLIRQVLPSQADEDFLESPEWEAE